MEKWTHKYYQGLLRIIAVVMTCVKCHHFLNKVLFCFVYNIVEKSVEDEDSTEKIYPIPFQGGDIRFVRPENVNITDIWVTCSLHTDAIPFAPHSPEAKSINIIKMTIRDCNPVHHNNSPFSIIIAMVGSGFPVVYKAVMSHITESITVVGRIGCYFLLEGEWVHLRLYHHAMAVDYACNISFTGFGSPSSYDMCSVCNIGSVLHNPFFGVDTTVDSKSIIQSDYLKYPSSSHLLLNSRVLRNNHCERKDNPSKSSFNWSPNSYAPLCYTLNTNYIKECESKIKEMSSFRQFVKYLLTNPKHNVSGESTEMTKINREFKHNLFGLFSPSLLLNDDCMHVYSNFFIRCCSLLDNNLKGGKDFNDFFFNNIWPLNHTPTNSCNTFVPKMVNALALFRLKDINNLPSISSIFVHPCMLFPAVFDKLSCEDRLVMYLNLFPYIYQDSGDNVIVKQLMNIIDLMGELYLIRRDLNRASLLQSKLTFYLGELENNAPPTFRSSSTHRVNHLYRNICLSSSLCLLNNFGTERSFGDTKHNSTRGKKCVISVSKREKSKAMCKMLIYHNPVVVLVKGFKPVEYTFSQDDLLRWVKYSLVDDYVMYCDSMMVVDTYLDEMLGDKSNWLERNLPLVNVLKDIQIEGVYSELQYNDHTYTSCIMNEDITSQPLEWLITQQENIRYVMGSNRKIHYFLVRGYVIAKWRDNLYPLAICSSIPVESMNSETYTYYHLKVGENWRDRLHDISLVSLRRLSKKNILAVPFKNKTVWALCPMVLNIYQFHEIPNDTLFTNLDYLYTQQQY